jgi:formylglycine-generating enzyme required for sulfatase activity
MAWKHLLSLVLLLSVTAAFAATPAASQAAPQAAAQPGPQTARECVDCPEIVVVPAGTFHFGSPVGEHEANAETGETPALSVTVAHPFAMTRTEITVAQFRAFIEATQYQIAGDCRVPSDGGWQRFPERSWQDPGFGDAQSENEPVVCVNFADAKAYAAWLTKQVGHTYRLPSEVEWEYAARGGTSTARFFSELDSDEASLQSLACDYANVYDAGAVHDLALAGPYARCVDGRTYTAPVASYRPNAFDLYDMIGNVREWTEDCYTASNAGRPDDARPWVWAGGCELRVVRGGSFASRPSHARAAAREAEAEALRQADLGFRLVREMN